jgi:hypothetical protein
MAQPGAAGVDAFVDGAFVIKFARRITALLLRGNPERNQSPGK